MPTITIYPTLAPTAIPETCFGPSELLPNKRLFAENEPSFICSPNCRYRFGVTRDGDLSLWAGKSRVWSAGTCCKGSEAFVAMQGSDGNLVIRSFVEVDSEDEKAQALWASGTTGNPDASLRIDDDGQARIVNADGIVVWETDIVHQVQPGTSSPSRAGVTTIEEQSDEEIDDISSPPVETTLDDLDEEKEALTDIEGSAKSQGGGSSMKSKAIGAAIALFLSAFALIIAFILIRKGSRQAGQSAVSSESRSNTDGAFPEVNSKRSNTEFDTSFDSDSNSGIEVVIPTGEGNAVPVSSSGFDLSPIIP